MESSFQIKSEKNPPHQQKKIQKRFLVLQTVLRTSGIAATLIGLGLMATNKQTTDYLDIQFHVQYSYSTAFKFFVAMNAVACFFSVVSLCLLLFLYCIKPSNRDQSKYFIIFLTDLIALVTVVPGIAAAITIGLLGLNGNDHAGWLPICDHFGKFCHRGIDSVLISTVAALIFLFLTIWSAWKLIKPQSLPASSNIYAY